MQYLWINPVSAGMCEEDSLKRFLERHGLTRVECRGDWGRMTSGKDMKLVCGRA